jgi:membrane-associated phospholipid phosphatase
MLVAAAGCAVAFVVLLVVAYHVAPARWADAAALDGFARLRDPTLGWYADPIGRLCDPLPFAAMAIALLVVAYIVRGPRHVAAVSFLLVAANLSSQLLKPALAYSRDSADWPRANDVAAAAFPSGHATASMTLALGALMIAPRALRPLVAALGGVFALLVAFSTLILSWHYPSDVVGGYLLATGWCLVVLAALRAAAARWPDRGELRRAVFDAVPAPPPRAVAGLVALLTAVAIVVAAGRADELAGYLDRHTWAAVVAVAIAACATALVAAVTALDGQRRR